MKGKRDAQIDVGKIRETLGKRVETNHRQCHRRKREAKFVDEPTRHNEPGGTQCPQRPRADKRYLSGRQMTRRRARIQRIEFAVHDTIKRHGRRTGTHHRYEDQTKRAPPRPAAIIARSHRHRSEGERKRKDRMTDLHKRSPFLEMRKHLIGKHPTSNIQPPTSNSQPAFPAG